MSIFYVEYKVNDRNRHVLFSKLIKQDIHIWNIRSEGGELRFKGKIRDKHQTLAILEQSLYNDIANEERNLKSIVKGNFGRILGILILLMLFALPNFVLFDVNVEGADRLLPKVNEVLERNEAKSFSPFGGLELDKIKDEIFSIPGVSFSELTFSFGKLKVFVLEELEVEVPKKADRVISTAEGEITRIVAKSGTKLVNVGDVVKKGQTLIEGVVYSKHKDSFEKVEAIGEARAKCELTFEKIIPEFVRQKVLTGQNQSGTFIEVFGLKIGRQKSDYVLSQRAVKPQKLFGILPITIYRWEEEEFIFDEKTPNIMFEMDKFENETMDEIFFFGRAPKVLDTKKNVYRINDGYKMEIKINAEMIISEDVFGQ